MIPGRAKPAIVILDAEKPAVQELPLPTTKLSPTTAVPALTYFIILGIAGLLW